MKLIKINKIEKEISHDIEIHDSHCFFANGILVHNSNAGVSHNDKDGIWIQARERIITIEKDNFGFAFFVKSNQEIFEQFFKDIYSENNIDPKEFTTTIYGEFAGPGIQKGVAISQLKEKSLFIFGVKISKPQDSEFKSYWLNSSNLRSKENRIYNIEDFKKFEIDVDMNFPQLSQNKFVELVEEVEKECPVAKEFGISGIGEGIVWVIDYEGNKHRFKTKGSKHSVSRVRTIASVDVEKLKSVQDFVEYSVTENRFNQAINEVFGSKENMDVKKMGDFLRWMIKDITSEEMDTMIENNLEAKDVNKYLSFKAREMFFESYNNL